jgi:membrane-bound lytic murein transglycosylase D
MSLKNLSGYLIAGLFVLPLSTLAQDNSSEIKQVDAIVIGQKSAAVTSETENKVEVRKTDLTPVEVVDARDGSKFRIIPIDEETIAQRFAELENLMPMPYNEHVKKYLDYFMYKRPGFVKEMLEKKEFYFPVFEKYLAKHNIPDEMKYLSLLESGLNPNAVSRAKAVGLWQFMPLTGKEYGLKITDYMDERRHIEKATDASFRYLKHLYRQFEDWELALAAYNTGPGRIRRAIRQSGKSDYWSLHNHIHPDTRAYVPQWEALNYLMNYSADHGIFADNTKVLRPLETENLLLDGPIDLEALVGLSYMDMETFKFLNPHLLTTKLPNHARNIELRMPVEHYAYFEENRDCILDSASIFTGSDEVFLAQSETSNTEYKEVKKYHTVRSGDYLGKIAEAHKVSVSDLKRWNNLKSNTVMKGQRLAIYKKEAVKVPQDRVNVQPEVVKQTDAVLAKNESGQLSNVKIVTASQERIMEGGNTADQSKSQAVIASAANTKIVKNVTKQVKRYHTVRNGDNLTLIAREYNTTVSDLKHWNDLGSSTIKKGQKLMYYTTVTEKVYETTPGNSPAKDELKLYTVQKGDTLWNISQRFGYSVEQLKQINGLTDSEVRIGQKLKI